jgi:hypothetical protein
MDFPGLTAGTTAITSFRHSFSFFPRKKVLIFSHLARKV